VGRVIDCNRICWCEHISTEAGLESRPPSPAPLQRCLWQIFSREAHAYAASVDTAGRFGPGHTAGTCSRTIYSLQYIAGGYGAHTSVDNQEVSVFLGINLADARQQEPCDGVLVPWKFAQTQLIGSDRHSPKGAHSTGITVKRMSEHKTDR